MTAESIGIFTIEFPDPYSISDDKDHYITLNSNISFQYPINSNIRTLSANGVAGGGPRGILFVPDLESDECKQSEKHYVPDNATRIHNLPPESDYSLIGFAPWFAPQCMLEYFDAMQDLPPVSALIVYQPGNSSDIPPLMSDKSWGLDDGGSWKQANDYPVYAISPASGGIIMQQCALYSGNVTDVPNGHDLASKYHPSDYVRLWAIINVGSTSSLPSLWVFLVIVLALLILIIGATSVGMHLVQRRRRRDLRNRIMAGEVDLEALGVKRLTVPRQILDKLPLYTYTRGRDIPDEEKSPILPAPPEPAPVAPELDTGTGLKSGPLTSRRASAPDPVSADPSSDLSQPTCPICLDDFEENETSVRELPCRHIFHPDCIDTFLLSNSSLCPMCKTSVLPRGTVPARITNAMVRRERWIRRSRERAERTRTQDGSPETSEQASSVQASPFARRILGTRLGTAMANRRVFSAPERRRRPTPDIEMASGALPPPIPETNNIAPRSDSVAVSPSPMEQPIEGCSPATDGANRREWARQRALALLGRNHIQADADEEANRRPAWRRGFRKVFPGFR